MDVDNSFRNSTLQFARGRFDQSSFRNSGDKIRAVIIRNHGVVAVGTNIHQARAVVEALEEWAKILTISKIFGGPKYVIDLG